MTSTYQELRVEMDDLKYWVSAAKTESGILAEIARAFSQRADGEACVICPANGVTCTENDCADDLLKYTHQEMQKRQQKS